MSALWDHTYRHWFASLEAQKIRCQQGLIPIREPMGSVAFASFEPPTATSTVLLLHGTGNDALFGWNLWIEGLVKRGFRVLAVDLEGHGHASSTVLASESFAQSLREIGGWLLGQGWSPQPVSICAYSLGGLFALEALARGYIKADRLLLLGVPLVVDISWRFVCAELMTGLRPVFWRHVYAFGWRASLPALGAWRREAFPIRLKGYESLSYPQAIAALFRAYSPLSRAAACQQPTLLIYGSQDYLASMATARRFQSVLPRSELHITPGANHFLLPWFPESLATGLNWLSLSNVALP